VALASTGPVRLDAVFVTARSTPAGEIDVVLAYRASNLSDVDLIVEVATTIDRSSEATPPTAGGVAAQVTLHPGPNAFSLSARVPRMPKRHATDPPRFTATTQVTFDQPSDRRIDAFDVRVATGGRTRDVAPPHPISAWCGSGLRRAAVTAHVYAAYNDATIGRWQVPDAELATLVSTIDPTRPVVRKRGR
jgi:hypothetical protein